MAEEPISTHTVKDDATTTIITHTTTIVSEHEGAFASLKEPIRGVVKNVKKTFRDYWFPTRTNQTEGGNDDDDGDDIYSYIHGDPSFLKSNSVLRRAYDYWKTLTQDADEAAKKLVIEAKKARDEAAAEAKYAFFGYKREAREAYEAAEKKYEEALAAAERAHEEAREKAKSKWFQVVEMTEREVENVQDQAGDITHEKWDRFKAAVNSLVFNPPKYGCNPTSQYWFSFSDPPATWDCREIWDHPNRHDHRHQVIKTLPKKNIPIGKVHDTLSGLFTQAGNKARNSPSFTSFESSLKPAKDYYLKVLNGIHRGEESALNELDTIIDKIKADLNEAKYYEEQTDAWLTSQWNAVIDSAGDAKSQYERVFKNTIRNIKNSRTEIYNSILNNLQNTITTARNNIHSAYQASKDQVDKSRLHKAIQDATESFSRTLKEAEKMIKSMPKNAYENAIDTFHRDTDYLKAKLEKAAAVASKSVSSGSKHVSKSGTSVIHEASKSASSIASRASDSASSLSQRASESISSAITQATDDAKSLVNDAQKSASSKYQSVTDKVRGDYEHATASISPMWGSPTPFSSKPLHRVQESYHKLVGNVHSQWFNQYDDNDLCASSVYGSILAIYFIFLANRTWRARNLRRMTDPRQTTVTVIKNDADQDPESGDHITTTKIERFQGRPSAEDTYENDRNSFGTALAQFTSVVPVGLMLLSFLELSGFSRVALHSLFIGLIVSQLLQGGVLDVALSQLGIVDGIHASGREIGIYMSWAVMGLAALANGIKALHD
ncbi:hypothetical protein BGX21_004358 [Mortierella sp. AD011]|nr:hypothetical protein BGX20_009832 [Mortierella sp. AD010]KAF9400418.1 hypothetical protein BGX21_004358 [Mortierella sp. AD011]